MFGKFKKEYKWKVQGSETYKQVPILTQIGTYPKSIAQHVYMEKIKN